MRRYTLTEEQVNKLKQGRPVMISDTGAGHVCIVNQDAIALERGDLVILFDGSETIAGDTKLPYAMDIKEVWRRNGKENNCQTRVYDKIWSKTVKV